MRTQWLKWARRIQSLSQAGLAFSKDQYDIERYQELRELSAEIMANVTDLEIGKATNLFEGETGYPTPKLDVRGVVFEDNQILMVRENTDDTWALPGGFCEIRLSASENIVKEIKEESGYVAVPKKILAVLDMNHHPHPPQVYQYYKIFILCQLCGGEATTSTETNAVGFFDQNHLPPLSYSRNTTSQIDMMFEFLRNPYKETIFD